MIIAGIDEAGRGPCFGPMTLSIAVIEKKSEIELKKIGVKDSKELLPKKRESLFDEIKKICLDYKTIIVNSVEINDLMVKHNLNDIEAMKVAELVNQTSTKIDLLIVDSPDSVKGKFEQRIRSFLSKEKQGTKILAENGADAKYVIVGAASVLAKVTRDNEIKKIINDFGDIGSGYPSDPKTKKFLLDYVKKHKKLPPFSRIFWSTCEKALNEVKDNTTQQKLF